VCVCMYVCVCVRENEMLSDRIVGASATDTGMGRSNFCLVVETQSDMFGSRTCKLTLYGSLGRAAGRAAAEAG
jgi:hypothetical protein